MKKDKKAEEKDAPARSFSVFVANVAEGELNDELSSELQALMAKLQDQADRVEGTAKGKLTLTLQIACNDRGGVAIGSEVKTTVPKLKRTPAQAWVDAAGNVVFQNPKQLTLGLRQVSDRAAVAQVDDDAVPEIREV